ncbi:hypothetical protein [Rheinheimera hassiensis]|uniref:hypothetical protein n=1 Tax=Rheinheimera hassiensis TaxID=1193627 RepID=UPI001F067C6A|nr:hypothetical protein [Rheinheimera hassiensis]
MQTVKRCLKEALSLSVAENDYHSNRKRQDLIEACFSLDAQFASSLSSLTANDEAKTHLIQEKLKQHQENKNLEDSFSSGGSIQLKRNLAKKFSSFCVKELGLLNANKAAKRRNQELFSFLKNVSELDNVQLFNLLSYFISAYGDTLNGSNSKTKDNLESVFSAIIENSKFFCSLYNISHHISLPNTIGNSENIFLSIDDCSKETAERFIYNWVSSNNLNSILISEPYFTLSDLEFIFDAINRNSSTEITLLSSLHQYKELMKSCNESGHFDLDSYVENHWREFVSPGKSPYIKFIFFGEESSSDPIIHDRWWMSVSGDSGIKLGTSINGIGNKLSGISSLTNNELLGAYTEMNGYAECRLRSTKLGERILYRTIQLSV